MSCMSCASLPVDGGSCGSAWGAHKSRLPHFCLVSLSWGVFGWGWTSLFIEWLPTSYVSGFRWCWFLMGVGCIAPLPLLCLGVGGGTMWLRCAGLVLVRFRAHVCHAVVWVVSFDLDCVWWHISTYLRATMCTCGGRSTAIAAFQSLQPILDPGLCHGKTVPWWWLRFKEPPLTWPDLLIVLSIVMTHAESALLTKR